MNSLLIAALLLLSAGGIVPRTGILHAQTSYINPSDSIPIDTMDATVFSKALFTFKTKNTPLKKALELFSRANGMQLRAETDIQGRVTASFERKNLAEAMYFLLNNSNLTWDLQGTMLVVSRQSLRDGDFLTVPALADSAVIPKSFEVIAHSNERIFKINYPRLKRNGSGSSAATISSTASGQAGSIQLSTSDELVFWQELEEQIKQLLTPTGKVVTNRLAGIVHVKDSPDNLETIQRFLEAVIPAATRQVEITARIYEVTLNDDRSLGVDWAAVNNHLTIIPDRTTEGQAITQLMRPGPSLKAPTLNLGLIVDQDLFQMTVAALKEQGEVRAVSQPRVVTLNNQPALVKVGTDLPFFSATVVINPTTNQREVHEEVRVITVGVVLSVTPQVSDDGWITLGIDPLISDLVNTLVSTNGSTAPVVDVKQSSSFIRLKDRQTVRISGLMHTKDNSTKRKIPLLGDLPLIGALFAWNYHHTERKELVIFITPRIVS